MTIYDELVARGLIAQVTDEKEIKELINNGKATFYIGFDPTADSLHVGHFMALCLMKRLQMAGNKPIVLIGGGTAQIGDPSGRTDMRQMMTTETINHNVECFKKQMSRFIDFGEGKAIMVNNADWLMDLNYVDVLREVGAHFSVNRMLTAECYKQRMEKGLSFLEFNYMIMQSYDFYTLFQKYGCNMEFGGDDQWSNMLGGTELIRRKLGKDAYAMTINLLLNSEGKKMARHSPVQYGLILTRQHLSSSSSTGETFLMPMSLNVSECSPSFLSRKLTRWKAGRAHSSTKLRKSWHSSLQSLFTVKRKPQRLKRQAMHFSQAEPITQICLQLPLQQRTSLTESLISSLFS